VADDIVVHGRVVGRVRGLKVRLTATARVEGDIIHKTIAIESGAHFEGSVTRQDDPLNSSSSKIKAPIKTSE
ncbi:polymer-forming cytoskeletal protein, partial [Amylibacter sp.]|nr:polymer-forming cytoskeletal protein [Amylibacter sp.]